MAPPRSPCPRGRPTNLLIAALAFGVVETPGASGPVSDAATPPALALVGALVVGTILLASTVQRDPTRAEVRVMPFPGVYIETLHNPAHYTYAQLETARAVAQLLRRGKL